MGPYEHGAMADIRFALMTKVFLGPQDKIAVKKNPIKYDYFTKILIP